MVCLMGTMFETSQLDSCLKENLMSAWCGSVLLLCTTVAEGQVWT